MNERGYSNGLPRLFEFMSSSSSLHEPRNGEVENDLSIPDVLYVQPRPIHMYVILERYIVWHGVHQTDVRPHGGKTMPDTFLPFTQHSSNRA